MIKQQNFKDLDYYKSNYNTFQSRAIKLYTNDKHSVINNHFRTKGNPFRYKKVSDIKLTYNDQFMFFCKELDKITKSNNLLEDTILYRGLRPNHHIEKAIKTKSFCERGFCSTTFDKDIAIEKATVKNENGEIIDFGWIMEIYAPKNTFGGVIMEHSVKPDEIEFLLPRNIIFNIFDCDKEKNILRVLTKNFNNILINKYMLIVIQMSEMKNLFSEKDIKKMDKIFEDKTEFLKNNLEASKKFTNDKGR